MSEKETKRNANLHTTKDKWICLGDNGSEK